MTPEFWNKEIPPLTEWDKERPVLGLKRLLPVQQVVAYDPKEVGELFDKINVLQDFHFTYLPEIPLFLMSPGIKVYRARDISELKFKGYLSKFEFEPTYNEETGELELPELTVTITPTPTIPEI